MPGTNLFQILIAAKNLAKKEFQDLKKDLSGASKETEKSEFSLKSLRDTLANVAAGAVAFGVTWKKAMDLGRAGAAILQTADSFDLLLEKVRASPDLLDQLRSASRNTIPDMQLMTSTATLLAGASGELATGLANATPELLEIAKAANKLNPALGDTTFLYNSIATGVKRASPLILDNLGLTIRIGEANEEYAKQLGKTASELTAEEQKMALLNETLRAGRVLIDQVGGSTEALTDPFDRLTASSKNIADTLKARLAPSLAEAANAAEILLTWTTKVNEAFEKGRQGVEQTSKTYQEYESGLRDLADTAGKVVMTQEQYDRAMEQGGRAAEYAKRAVVLLTEEQWNARQVVELLGDSRRESIDALYDETAAVIDATDAQMDLTQAMSDLRTLIAGELGNEMERFTERTGDLQTRAEELRSEIEKLESKSYLTNAQKEELQGLQEEFGEVQAAILATADEHDEATRRILFNILTQRAEIGGLSEDEYQALLHIAEGWGLIDENTATAMGAADEFFSELQEGAAVSESDIRELAGRMLGLPSRHDFRVHTTYTSSGNPPPAYGGATPRPRQRGQYGRTFLPGLGYLVGEEQPELVVPLAPGKVVSGELTDRIINQYNLTINEAGRVVDPVGAFELMRALARS